MRRQCLRTICRSALLAAAGLMASVLPINAQQGQGIGVGQRAVVFGTERGLTAGGGGQFSVMVGNGEDVGASLLKACDSNQDGVATPVELRIAALAWFQSADTDTNNALSSTELAAALKLLFPPPQPPPGFPPPPEEFGLHHMLAKKLMAAIDVNKDEWMTFKEAIAFFGQHFSQWDSNADGVLNAAELSTAFAQFMAPDPSEAQTVSTGGAIAGPGAGTVQFFRVQRP